MDIPRHRTRDLCIRSIILVKWFRDDHFIAGLDDGEHRRHHCFGRTTGDRYLGLRVKGHAIELLHPGCQCLAEILCPPRDRILVVILIDRFACRSFQFCRTGEIRKALARLIALCLRDKRVISRITDSEKLSAREGWVEKNCAIVLFRDDEGVPGVAGFIHYRVGAEGNKLSGLQ